MRADSVADEAIKVPSVNSPEARKVLREIKPDLVVVNGTRIIGRKTLEAVGSPFINLHAGITPRYRGVHGAYWAFYEGKPELAGVTVHRVDTGIDTGTVLAQRKIEITSEDCYSTYSYLQLAAGLEALKLVCSGLLSGNCTRELIGCEEESKLWYHPTVWQYISARVMNGVK